MRQKNWWWRTKMMIKIYYFFLQEKLMMSFESRVSAVRRIVSNDGKNTSGFDKIVWNSPSVKFQAIIKLRKILTQKSGNYQEEQSDELRPLGILNMIGPRFTSLNSFMFGSYHGRNER